MLHLSRDLRPGAEFVGFRLSQLSTRAGSGFKSAAEESSSSTEISKLVNSDLRQAPKFAP